MAETITTTTQAVTVDNTSAKFGRNQKIGMIWITLPFTVATICLFMGKADFNQWASFMQFLVPLSMAIILGLGALVSIKGQAK